MVPGVLLLGAWCMLPVAWCLISDVHEVIYAVPGALCPLLGAVSLAPGALCLVSCG